jgi:hypothetical protein
LRSFPTIVAALVAVVIIAFCEILSRRQSAEIRQIIGASKTSVSNLRPTKPSKWLGIRYRSACTDVLFLDCRLSLFLRIVYFITILFRFTRQSVPHHSTFRHRFPS